MHEDIVLSGFGGQGVMFAGQLLAYAGLREGKHVAWVPSYGPEMRGGTAHVTVVVSDEEIGSLIVAHPTVAVVMNLPSFERFVPAVKPGGLLIVNSSLIAETVDRDDILTLRVPANDISLELGNDRLANMVMVGALLASRPVVSKESVVESLKKILPERRQRLLEINEQAMQRGIECSSPSRSSAQLTD
ncbi:MAG: 2-oxoacid:acceptor oxidoreductase family protein [Chloroflexi bacterium]|nr:2-oxoacid:acceptor oxidoreductase family protein [Chloroflexota bacterium]MDA8188200.1 2-oxoacid:acceptor oxidoreductase family protein [Dehalococcoidales bacterium]